ncbi:hypothetical protein Pcinc_024587 [Petrolisthes cinctipes]|uniref:BPL/LPL catalytic domain-containing protein n=1 Tax=Petrolisthes cinctipes TaxID=88211 RepID=A0AAE1KDB8_PETCI|nr:hypothetical protein Pcinc_024587 [Petrolisthes cinctipes]
MLSLKKLSTNLLRNCGPLGAVSTSLYGSTSQPSPSRPRATEPPKRVVFISQSTDVFSNLAFEDWLYKNWSFEKRSILFLWRNSPCVVIGRHQNPLVEANIPYLESAGVPVARRGSGGGAVYHDHGNLNCTFFTARERYDRRQNLELICNVLNHDFGIQARANSRDDIVVGHDNKVSGTAAKLGRTSAYHHCTLLVRTDRQQLRLALQGDKTIQIKATHSVSSPVANLGDIGGKDMTVEKLLASLGRTYLTEQEQDPRLANGFTLVNPTDDWFPGLGKIEADLRSGEWIEGKTPRFTIRRSVSLPPCLAGTSASANITVQAYHGVVEEVRLEDGLMACEELTDLVLDISTSLKGTPYTPGIFCDISNRLRVPQPLHTQRSFL